MTQLRQWTRKAKYMSFLLCAALLASVFATGAEANSLQSAATVIPLGAAQNFAVLAATTVTNTHATTVYGSLGVWPGTAVTGFPPGSVTGGTIRTYPDAIAGQAQTDAHTAYANAVSQTCTKDLTGKPLGGLTLKPGVYCFDSSANLTGTLTLDARGTTNPVWIFQMGSTLITGSNSSVQILKGKKSTFDNVYWQVGSSATISTGTNFAGNILALTSITLGHGASVQGRSIALGGAVTMDLNHVSINAGH